MTAILRAPELSATSRMERIWIMAVSPRARGHAAGTRLGLRG